MIRWITVDLGLEEGKVASVGEVSCHEALAGMQIPFLPTKGRRMPPSLFTLPYSFDWLHSKMKLVKMLAIEIAIDVRCCVPKKGDAIWKNNA